MPEHFTEQRQRKRFEIKIHSASIRPDKGRRQNTGFTFSKFSDKRN